MNYLTAYMCLLAIVNFLFTCAYQAMGNHKMALATGATTSGCFLAALVSLTALPS
jgi:hypothetical protein